MTTTLIQVAPCQSGWHGSHCWLPHLESHYSKALRQWMTFRFCFCCPGGRWTGAALNPARVLGPLAVFKCGKDAAYIYILAQLLAAILACSIFAFVSGWGPLNPYQSSTELNLTWHEAIKLWVTGSPPARLRFDGRETNINDVLEERKCEKLGHMPSKRHRASFKIKDTEALSDQA
eukprot:GHUV01021223.1.p1 GENE.GHUV01021223.1~~GHUV01021223.1.p1  ORF type:complete len:176 (+),score=25.69 GHUV01021223.1:987-1514(+)